MQILRLVIGNFRGFSELALFPRGHVALVGPPAGGRTDTIEAIVRVLDPDSTRGPLTDDLDFHRRDTSDPIAIEVVLGHLGDELEQHFLYKTENWSLEKGTVVPDLEAAASGEVYPRILRLGYRAKWSAHEELAEQVVYFARSSDLALGQLDVVPRRDRQLLPFRRVEASAGPLAMGDRSEFRTLVQRAASSDLDAALTTVRTLLADASQAVMSAQQVKEALDAVFQPIQDLIGVDPDSIGFTPSGGSSSQLLRSLVPDIDVSGFRLPLSRVGDTASSIISVAQALAALPPGEGVIVIDDFGEAMDARAATHLAGVVSSRAAQAWISTRRAQVAETLGTDALIRLSGVPPQRSAHQLPLAPDRTTRVSLRHLGRQLIPAADAEVVVIVEGPDDQEAYESVSNRMLVSGTAGCLTAARAVAVHPGGIAAGGGVGATGRLASLARDLGFRTVIVLDGDTSPAQVTDALALADVVVRLPDGFAIEWALVHGVRAPAAEAVLRGLVSSFGVPVTPPNGPLSDQQIRELAVEVLKKRGKGLHAQFVDELELVDLSPLVVQAVRQMTDRAAIGLRQLQT